MSVKRGDVVILSLAGKDYNALVHMVCPPLASHTGKNGEPTLHLSYVPDEPIINGKPKVRSIGYIPQSEMIFDVVHTSHEFSAEYMSEHKLRKVPDDPAHQQLVAVAKAEIQNRRGAGEWRVAVCVPRITGVADVEKLAEVARLSDPDSTKAQE